MFMKWRNHGTSPMKENQLNGDRDNNSREEVVSCVSETRSPWPGFTNAERTVSISIVDEDGNETGSTLQAGNEAEKTSPRSQQLCTRLGASCQKLWETEMLLDCTVACSHGKVMAHKIVLSASSDYLLNLLHDSQSDHPTLILDTSVDCLKHLMRFMYYGMVPAEENEEFFELAAKLKLHGIKSLPQETAESAEDQQTSGFHPPGRSPSAPPPPAPDTTPPPAPRRRRGRPRKTPQGTTRAEDVPPVEGESVAQLDPSRPPPKELNVKVVQTLAGAVELFEQPRTGSSVPRGALSPTGRGRSGLVATAGIPEQLFGGPAAADDQLRHTDLPGGSGGGGDGLGDGPAADSDSDAPDAAGGAEMESEPAWESVLEPSVLVSADQQDSYEQEQTPPVAAAHISKSERPTRMTASSVQCGYCGKMCCNKETLKVHRRIHTDERPFSCPVPGCDKAFRQRIHLQRHALCHDASGDLPKYPCHNCGRVFRHRVNLERHREQFEREGRPCSPPRPRAKPGHRFPCHLCGKKFISQAAFDNHVRVHTNQRPFVCSVCDKGFKQKSHLTEHERIHSGQKPFKCAECDLTFYNRSRFKMHQVQHVNEALQMGKDPSLIDPNNKFPACPVCFKRFINASNLRLHERSHSSDKPHRCHLCTSRFKLARTLTKHLAAHARGDWATPAHMAGRRTSQQGEEQVEPEPAVSVSLAEGAGEGVIVLREEEDGSLTYVPGLQEADTDGRVVQVMLGDPEPTNKDPAERLMSQEGSLASKWVAATVQHMLPAGVDDPSLPDHTATDPAAGPSGVGGVEGEGHSSSAAVQQGIMETDVDGGGD